VGKKNGWTLLVGGSAASRPRLAEVLVENLDSEEALDTIKKIMAFYKENGKKLERIGRMMDRIGFDAFQSAILGT